ncbi:MAG: ROK family protein [Limnochordia bacterium]
MGINMLDVKQANAQAVLWELWAHRAASVRYLAQRTGLSFATVGSILAEFVETGEVILGDLVSGTGGRPSQAYVFNAEFAHVLALSAQVRSDTHMIRACVGNLYGETIAEREYPFAQISLESFGEAVAAALNAHPTIKVLACAIPGVVRDGVVVVNDYPALDGTAFPEYFREKYGVHTVVSNDVNAALMGYAAETEPGPVIVGIYFPKHFDPGSAVMVNGKVLEGDAGWAGEVKLLPWDVDWLAVDYQDPLAIGPAIARLIGVFCAVVNPGKIVLYGDFLSEDVQRAR